MGGRQELPKRRKKSRRSRTSSSEQGTSRPACTSLKGRRLLSSGSRSTSFSASSSSNSCNPSLPPPRIRSTSPFRLQNGYQDTRSRLVASASFLQPSVSRRFPILLRDTLGSRLYFAELRELARGKRRQGVGVGTSVSSRASVSTFQSCMSTGDSIYEDAVETPSAWTEDEGNDGDSSSAETDGTEGGTPILENGELLWRAEGRP